MNVNDIAKYAAEKYFTEHAGHEIVSDEAIESGDVTIQFVTRDTVGDLCFWSFDPNGDGFPKYDEETELMYRRACIRYIGENHPDNTAFHIGHIICNLTDDMRGAGIAAKIFG